MPPGSRSLRLVFRAAGFMATRVLRRSPGVWMSWLLKWTWKPETPARVPAGGRVSAGGGGGAGVLVAREGRAVGGTWAGQLHAAAGVAGEADGDRLGLFQDPVAGAGTSRRRGVGNRHHCATSFALRCPLVGRRWPAGGILIVGDGTPAGRPATENRPTE